MPRYRRPTIDTKFRIDLDWWTGQNRDIRVFLTQSLCEECRSLYQELQEMGDVDSVDPETGEVRCEDALWSTIRTCCSNKPGYLTPNTPIIDSIFLTFVANGNEPLSPKELHEVLDRRPPETILRMLTGGQVYLGIRPVN